MGAPRSHPLLTAPPSSPLRSPSSQPFPAPPSQPHRLQLSGLIDDRIRGVTARERQRSWLVNTVVLAQTLITLMVVPGYLLPTPAWPLLLTLGVALLFYIAAFVFNRFRRELRVAVYMLIGGGAVATTAQVFVTAVLTSGSQHTAQSALLFLPIILEAGLFLTPELTLLVASAAAVVTASAILLALALAADASNLLSQAYLVMVYTLGLEAFIGYLAWRLAQFIYETVKNAQADEDLRFAEARLSAAQRQMADQRRQLIQDVATIQLAVSSVLAHEYNTHIEPPEGDLAPLAQSLNLLIEQLRSTYELERRLRKTEAEVPVLIEIAGSLTTGAPASAASEPQIDSSLYELRAALTQTQVTLARRQARLQEIAAQIGDTVRHSLSDLALTRSESGQAQQIAGKLVSIAQMLQESSTRQLGVLAQARQSLSLALPAELTRGDLGQVSQWNNELAGLSPDILKANPTGEYPIFDPQNLTGIDIPLLAQLHRSDAAPTPSSDGATAAQETDATGTATGDGDLPSGLADAWALLNQLQGQTVTEMRAIADFMLDIEHLSKLVRHLGVGLDSFKQSIETVDTITYQMQQMASFSGVGLDTADDSSVTGTPRRGPLPTHPLASDQRLPADLLSPEHTPQSDDTDMAAPGSLRISDLIGSGSFGPAEHPAPPQPHAPTDADPGSEPSDSSPA